MFWCRLTIRRTRGLVYGVGAAAGIKAFYGPFGDFADPAACEAQFRNAFLMGCAGAWTLHPSQVAIAERVFSPDPAEVAFARKILAEGCGDRREVTSVTHHVGVMFVA